MSFITAKRFHIHSTICAHFLACISILMKELISFLMFGNSRVMNVSSKKVTSLNDFKSTFYVFLNSARMAAVLEALTNLLLM